MVARLGEVMWVVDLNRQSLDRVVPDIAAGRLAAMFEAAGWHTVMVKYGPLLQQRPDLRARIDAMPNEEYQRLLRADAQRAARAASRSTSTTSTTPSCWPPSATSAATTSPSLIDGYRQADAVRDRPSVVFAYTIKGWSLPTEGHPANHSALLNHAQYRELAAKLGEDPDDPFAPLDPARREAELCARDRRSGSSAAPRRAVPAPKVPHDLGRKHTGKASHPAGLRALLRRPRPRGARGGRARRHGLARTSARRTNLGGWINKAGHLEHRRPDRLVRRRHRHARALARARPRPPHRARDRRGQPRRRCSASSAPPGRATASRCCRSARSTTRSSSRALEPWSFGIYAGGQSILVGTPSGVTLGPEGGAHQSVITPSRSASSSPAASPTSPPSARTSSGASCTRCQPARQARRHERLLPALDAPDRPVAAHRHARGGARRRLQAASRTTRPRSTIAVMGALVPEALAAADTLTEDAGLTSRSSASPAPTCCSAPSRPARASATATRTRSSASSARASRSSRCSTATRTRSPSSGSPITCLGVQHFGQAGDIAELYEHHQIDAESVVGAALDLLG